MKSNKEIYAEQCKEDLRLKKEMKELLLSSKTIGVAVSRMFYLFQGELLKIKKFYGKKAA